METTTTCPLEMTILFHSRSEFNEFARFVSYLCCYVCYETYESVNDKVNACYNTNVLEIGLTSKEVESINDYFFGKEEYSDY
jgi:hypothetical protein